MPPEVWRRKIKTGTSFHVGVQCLMLVFQNCVNSMQICLQAFLWPHIDSSFLLILMLSYLYFTKLHRQRISLSKLTVSWFQCTGKLYFAWKQTIQRCLEMFTWAAFLPVPEGWSANPCLQQRQTDSMFSCLVSISLIQSLVEHFWSSRCCIHKKTIEEVSLLAR